MDSGVAARHMRRARIPNGDRHFTVSEFPTPLQVASFFSSSRLAAKVRQQLVAGRESLAIDVTDGMGAMEVDAAVASEETNFARAKKSFFFGVVAISSSNHL